LQRDDLTTIAERIGLIHEPTQATWPDKLELSPGIFRFVCD
jgi:hypothetical protein